MSVSALLEAVAKSIKHATVMSTILATELFQARREAAIATSKLLLENSSYELRNAVINAKSLFDNKIKAVARVNYEVQQQRFLASYSTNTNVQQQKSSYSALGIFKRSRQAESIFLPLITRRNSRTSPETGSGKGTRSGNSRFYSQLFLVPKKNGKLHPVIDLSLLNQYIRKQPFKMVSSQYHNR